MPNSRHILHNEREKLAMSLSRLGREIEVMEKLARYGEKLQVGKMEEEANAVIMQAIRYNLKRSK